MAGMPARDTGAVIEVLRSHRDQVAKIAARFGLSNVRVAPTGRVIVDVGDGGNYDTLAAFDAAVAEEIGVRIDAHPAEVLQQPGHSPDFDEAVVV